MLILNNIYWNEGSLNVNMNFSIEVMIYVKILDSKREINYFER